VTPEQLIVQARALVAGGSPGTAGLWPRAAALLARQALEGAVDRLWAVRAQGMEQASARAQLSCLAEYLRDPPLAGEVAFTWSALSHACHHHAYELGPTAEELEARFAVVDRLVTRLLAAAATPK
jgi:hypothetical protein